MNDEFVRGGVHDEGDIGGFYNVKLSDMKELNVAKTMNSTKKVEVWLNSEEGLAWINERMDKKSHTALGSFL